MRKSEGVGTLKNPLAQAFGMVLRIYRDRIGKSSDEIAENMGIGGSYYRLIESGANNLHISKVVALADAFEGKFDFDAVSKLLMALSIMEAIAKSNVEAGIRYSESLKLAAEKLSEYDRSKFGLLFNLFAKNRIFEIMDTKSSDTVSELIKSQSIDKCVEQFLVNYKDFGKTLDVVQNEYATNFLRDIPTFYSHFLTEIKEALLRMPVMLGFDALWQWEEKNKSFFRSVLGVVEHHSFITDIKNLERYKYQYLWEPNFENIKIIYLDDSADPLEVKQTFGNNLRSVLRQNNQVHLLDTFDDKMGKIEFKYCDKNLFEFDELVEIEYANDYTYGEKLEYNATWVFLLSGENSNIGIMAHIGEEDKLISYGRSLKIDSTLYLVKQINALWENKH